MSDPSGDATTAPPSARTDRVRILGCEIDRVDMPMAVERCAQFIEHRTLGQHMAINAAKLVSLQSDKQLRDIVNECELVTADGQAVVWASRLLGDPLPTRVAGIDLMYEVFALAEKRGYRVYILGAREDVLETAIGRIRDRHPSLNLVGWRDGYFAPGEDAEVAEQIRSTNPDVLLVAISSPRKEYFLGRYGRKIGAPFIMGVGGAIDVVAGLTRRAPRWVQRLGMEWLYRLLQEPRRLARRYAVTNVRFLYAVGREILGRRRA